MAALHSRCRHYIFVLFFLSFFFFVFPRLISAVGDWMLYFYTWCGLNANLECRSEMCCMRLAGNAGPKKSQSEHLCTNLSGHIFATKARIDNQKKLVKQQCLPHMSSQYGELSPLAAEICWRVSGTPANFNGFRILAALLHGTLVVGVSQTLRH